MSIPPTWTSPLSDHLLMSFLYAAILVPIILGVQRLAGERLSPTAKHALWFLFLIRLSLPELPESSLSVLNLTPPSKTQVAPTFSTIRSSPILVNDFHSSDFTPSPHIAPSKNITTDSQALPIQATEVEPQLSISRGAAIPCLLYTSPSPRD